ncbi:transglycosylase SLT domain-containing protein [Sinomonas humi]|uniref:Peptidase C51 domain-containing protein n=1 Tax=Sinomonas humi TaxID=1338436 RepID=A0A0B2AIY9_9MICC|nr:transglycosylase SLT domain-containing protein [Sinomonas humi]KHL01747.1 hypothetical protein LK10_14820 [Sinomonas humi]
MKAVGGAIGGLLALLVFVVMMMSGSPDPQSASAVCAPGGSAQGVPNGWGPAVDAAAKTAGLPSSVLAAQLAAESGWNPKATSPVGAMGLAQFMPETWKTWGNGADVLDPVSAIGAQGRFMGDLYRRAQAMAKGSSLDPVSLALAGYNAGWGAVEQFHGVPPYGETQDYVAKILDSAKKYAGAGDSAVAACSQAGAAGDGDDLPWKNAPTWVQVGADNPAARSPLGFFNRECVDFALFRVNQELGWTAGQPWKVTNSSFRGDGVLLGSANTPGEQSWLTGWQVKGWATGKDPKPGAVVFYGPGVGGADATYGHVAVVKSVAADGTYVEEGYNGNPAPNDHQYYTRTVKDSVPTAFLYVPKG